MAQKKVTSLRLSQASLMVAAMLAEDRQEEAPETLRAALALGLRVLATTTPPHYGGRVPESLAAELRPVALALNDFLIRHGQGSFSGLSVASAVQRSILPGREPPGTPTSTIDQNLKEALSDFPETI